MKEKVLLIVNQIIVNKGLPALNDLNENLNFREDLGFDSFDLAEFTVKIERDFGVDIFKDGIVNTVKEVYNKLL